MSTYGLKSPTISVRNTAKTTIRHRPRSYASSIHLLPANPAAL